MTKKCSHCMEVKEASEFYVKNYRKKKFSGLQSRCKSCNTIVVREYRERLKKKFNEWVRSDEIEKKVDPT